ncbi:MAG TPA: CHAT domain-containing protein, partial [Chloroflexaceae bacterium]|nr:CHAT domain-containing protein [Chloroflexaceae bacterium]
MELRFTQPDSDADIRLSGLTTPAASFDLVALSALEYDPRAYGLALSRALFASPELRQAFARARAGAAAADAPLRLRLFVGPSAAELHALRWETLCDPEDGSPMLTGEGLLFSRYLSSGDWRPVQLRPRGALRALAVAANPAGLAAYGMAPVDVAGELARVREQLGPDPAAQPGERATQRVAADQISVTTPSEGERASLARIGARLREGYDIFYLVCHGTLAEGEPWLWLEGEDGELARVSGNELVASIRDLGERPRLVVLASCQSAGGGRTLSDGDALAGLGPRLAEAGVPAVLAMQGQVSLETVAAFMGVFFAELQRDGLIDRAAAVARGAVRARDDFWMPTLFMRLRGGQLWYVPGFGDDGAAFEKWPALVRNVRRGQSTPVIGGHLSEPLLGSSRDLAQSWAEQYRFPMAPHQREDLPQVAQYLTVHQDHQFPREELGDYMRLELLRRWAHQLPALPDDAPLDELFAAVGALRREADPAEPYRVLAELPFPIYITASTDNLLEAALRAAGKDPRVDICRWNRELERFPSVFDDEPDYVPDVQHPFVFHLFGLNVEPDSVVLTEDDYFDYLIGVSLNKELIPVPVREALADTALLFLGFRLEDWNFRVLFRSIMSQEGGRRRRRYANIAGQVMPEEGAFLDPERARRYLEGYFGDADISIFWGSPQGFMQELVRQ